MTIRYKQHKFFLLLALIVSSHVNLFSQTDEAETKADSTLYLIDSLKAITPNLHIESDFNNKVVFWGRDFGNNQFGFENLTMFSTGSGFYYYYRSYVWSAMRNKYAKTDLGFGFEKQINDALYASFAYERWFFNNGNNYVRNALRNYLEADLGYDLNIVTINPTVYYMFGTDHIFQTDIMIKSDLFLFSFFKCGAVSVKPSATATFANQAFLPIYNNYPVGYINEQKFKCVDAELSLPLILTNKNLHLECAVHYNAPIRAVNEDPINPFVYFSAKLAYNFYFDNGRIKKMYGSL